MPRAQGRPELHGKTLSHPPTAKTKRTEQAPREQGCGTHEPWEPVGTHRKRYSPLGKPSALWQFLPNQNRCGLFPPMPLLACTHQSGTRGPRETHGNALREKRSPESPQCSTERRKGRRSARSGRSVTTTGTTWVTHERDSEGDATQVSARAQRRWGGTVPREVCGAGHEGALGW